MRVRSALVGCAGNDGRSVDAFLVCNVVNRQGVFIVTIADVTAVILGVRAFVFNALCVVDITILSGTARAVRLRDIVDVDVDQTRSALAVARLSADSDSIAELLVLKRVSERVKDGSERQALRKFVPPRRCENDRQEGH